MSGAPVSVADVRVRYEGSDRFAVDGVSVDIAGGELIVLLGPSGCGKSTLLRTINRLVVPESGSITIDGTDVANTPPEVLRRRIGYVIQAVGLFPHMTIGKNVGLVPELLGWDRARIATRVDELLTLVSLEPARYRDRVPRELSGGEQQRAGVARALAAEPPLLLMDEPFGAVDAIVRQSLQDETVRIHRALGTTILFVTHDVDEALRIADRIVVMSKGRIEQFDTPLHVLAKPATPYVAQLLDSHDTVRRLQLLNVRDAMRASNGAASSATDGTPSNQAQTAGAPQVQAGATLRQALSLLLESAQPLEVVDDGARVGSLSFDDVRRAIAATE